MASHRRTFGERRHDVFIQTESMIWGTNNHNPAKGVVQTKGL
jgi:hypothetical protein